METRTYTEKSNARRAARAAGVDPGLVFETDDGFTFTPPSDPAPHTLGREIIADEKATTARDLAIEHSGAAPHDLVDTAAKAVDDGIPAFCKISPEERKAAWERNPPKAAAIKPEIPMAKKAKRKKGDKAANGSGADKNATLLSMLKKGATVEELTKALGWLPHTLRARISRLNKPKSKGGEGINIERERVDGVTSYRIA